MEEIYQKVATTIELYICYTTIELYICYRTEQKQRLRNVKRDNSC